ncbi:MAG: transposase family protein [Myxococcaceae bacterium]|nr:transposase family protein [Myxococcaceae bacterium]
MEAPAIRSLSDEFRRSTLGHGARDKRLLRVSAAFGRAPSASFPALFEGLREAKRGYEFLGNPAVLPDDVLYGHVLNTLDRCASRARVLLVMDMTELDFTAHPATRGLGPIGDGRGRGVHVLSVLALDAATREPLGVLPPQRWVRDPVIPGRRKAESTYARRLRARESEYWLRAIRSSRAAIGPSGAGPRYVVVADQGADIFDNFATCRAHDFGFVLRLFHDRALLPTADPKAAPSLLARLAQRAVLTHKTVEVRAAPKRAARVARCEVRVLTVTLRPPQTQPPGTAAEVLTVVQVREVDPPAGEDAVCWNLGTDAPVETAEAALQIVSEYEARWTVEKDQPWRTSSGVLYLAPRGGLRARSAADSALPFAVLAA